MADLHAHDVDFVIVHGAFFRTGDYEDLIERLDERQDLSFVERTEWDGSETRLYRVLRPPVRAGVTGSDSIFNSAGRIRKSRSDPT